MPTFIKRHTGTFQFGALALLYAIPLFSGRTIELVSWNYLSSLIVKEFGAIMIGGFIIGVFFVPFALSKSKATRWILLVLVLVIMSPISNEYWKEYGTIGMLSFIWLVFVNYCGAFLPKTNFQERSVLIAEIGLRWLFFIALFTLLATLLQTSVHIDRWAYNNTNLTFGFIYFSLCAILEGVFFFERSVTFFYDLIEGKKSKL